MIPAKQLMSEIVNSLRHVIGPAIDEPYPKAQAYMAALILEFLLRQVEERADIEQQKDTALATLFGDLVNLGHISQLDAGTADGETRLCHLIEWLYEQRARLGEETFAAANQLIRHTLRQMLDQELKIAKAD
jgi:flagellar biosynthesis/type III secretory pathway protein FliH